MKVGSLVKIWNARGKWARSKYYLGTIVGDTHYMEPDDEERMGEFYWPILVPGFGIQHYSERRLELLCA